MVTISRGNDSQVLRRLSSIRTKYLLSFLGLTALVILVLNTYPLTITRDLVLLAKENSIWPHTVQIGNAVEVLERMTPESVGQVVDMLETDTLSRLTVVNENMDELYSLRTDDRGYNERELFNLARTAMSEGTDEFRAVFADGAFMSYSAAPIMDGDEVVGAVCAYEYDADEGEIILGLQQDLARISVAIGLFSVILSIIIANKLSARVTRVLDGIKNVREGEYTYRVNVTGHDELAQLGEEFNSLTDRLQVTEEKRRRFVADASHELKTPLAAIRLLSDTILETDNMDRETLNEFVDGIREESERLSRTTTQLLALTKLDNTSTTVREPVDVTDAAKSVIQTLTPIAKTAKVELIAHLSDNAVIMATRDEIFQIIYNLVENAIKYNRPQGTVTLTAAREAENVVITVEDTGIGIPEQDMPYIFDRFYRVEKSRSSDQGGTGLGLSIVQSTAQRHGGEVKADRLPQGMRFTVTFPSYVNPTP